MSVPSRFIRITRLCAIGAMFVPFGCGNGDGGLSGPSTAAGDGAPGSGGTEGGPPIACQSDNQCTPYGMLCNKAAGICEDPLDGGASGSGGAGGAGGAGGGSGGIGTGGTADGGSGGETGGTGGTSGAGGAGGAGATGGSGGSGGTTCDPDTHSCNGVCVSNASVLSCGTSCSPCPTTPNGDATCDGVDCGISCHAGHLLCGSACSACPPNAVATTCDGAQCLALSCQTGYHVCGGACASNADPATCGTSCTPCQAPVNGTATCAGGTCGVACNPGAVMCNGTCAVEGPNACGPNCTQCAAPTNGIATCENHVCGSVCMPGANPCPTGCCPWTAEEVGSGVGGHIALRLEGSGAPHVAFISSTVSTYSTSYSVIHAVRGSADWVIDSPDYASSSSSDNPRYSISGVGLALDATGVPYVGYHRTQSWQTGSRNITFRVARKPASSWTIEVVDSVQNTYSSGLTPPITLQADGSGAIHAAFLECCFNNYHSWARYAIRSGTTWTVEDLPSASSVALAVSVAGAPHVLLSDYNLEHTVKNGATWETSSVSSDYMGGPYYDVRNESIVVDPQGDSHVCYQSTAAVGPLVYAHQSSGQWVTEVADSFANAGESCAIALDSKGQPLICHREATGASLRCAKKTGGAWQAAPIPIVGEVGAGIDVAYDTQDRPHVVYFDETQGKWMYLH